MNDQNTHILFLKVPQVQKDTRVKLATRDNRVLLEQLDQMEQKEWWGQQDLKVESSGSK